MIYSGKNSVMRNKKSLMPTKMTRRIIGTIVILLLVFSIIISSLGYAIFLQAIKNDYAYTTAKMGNTAAALINGDHIDDYLAGKEKEEYKTTKEHLDTYCFKMELSLLYLIKVDQSDYGSYTSIFNCVNHSILGPEITEWELGFKRDTTNEQYAEMYQNIYEYGKKRETIYRFKELNGFKPHVTTMVPVKNSEGKVVGILCLQRMFSDFTTEATYYYVIPTAIVTVLMSAIVAVLYAIFIRKQFVKPLRRVSNEATRFAQENTKSEPLGKISKFEELDNLAKSIDKMEDEMLEYISNLTSITAEKERISAELSVASIIQENSIPNIYPAFPERMDFDIYATMDPAKEVGGDFYNFFLIDDDHLAFVIGDVSGKGVPAALFMMVTNIIISDRTHMGGTPGEILTYVNDNICAHNKADMFVTLWLGILEISTGKITASNAGHDDAVIIKENGEVEMFKTKHGLVVGAMGGLKYKDFDIQLNKGDRIFLYTDGVPEATDKDNNMFTIEGMLDSLAKYADNPPKEVLKGVRNDVNAFVGDAPQFDDLTMLCIELGNDEKMEMNTKKLTVDATNDNLHEVMAFVDTFLEENDCPMKAQMQLDLSVEEIYVNIANYAYDGEIGKAEIEISKVANEITITFKDSGVHYNPLEKEDPDVTLSAEERKIGGLGIFLVKKNVDSVFYSYENNQNILTLKKRI